MRVCIVGRVKELWDLLIITLKVKVDPSREEVKWPDVVNNIELLLLKLLGLTLRSNTAQQYFIMVSLVIWMAYGPHPNTIQ